MSRESCTEPRNSRDTNRDSRFYIELVKPDDFPVVFVLSNAWELEPVVSSYDVSRNIKNGDKLVLQDSGSTIEFSRINGRKSLALGIPIGINSASIDDLIALPGIGITLAERIVEYREFNHGLKSIDELRNVRGIRTKKIEAIRPLISLD